MSDKITVNVDDLRVALRSHLSSESRSLRAALAEHDKAEQERLGQLVMVHKDDVDVISQYSTPYRWATTLRYPYYEATPKTVEALGEFYPHQTDHEFDGRGSLTCRHVVADPPGDPKRCGSPEWAHTPPAVPDWQTDPNVLVVQAGVADDLYLRDGEKWRSQTGRIWSWQELQRLVTITPVGWRRDPDSIVIPKSALNAGPVSTVSARLLREWARHAEREGRDWHVIIFDAIADALEADQ